MATSGGLISVGGFAYKDYPVIAIANGATYAIDDIRIIRQWFKLDGNVGTTQLPFVEYVVNPSDGNATLGFAWADFKAPSELNNVIHRTGTTVSENVPAGRKAVYMVVLTGTVVINGQSRTRGYAMNLEAMPDYSRYPAITIDASSGSIDIVEMY